MVVRDHMLTLFLKFLNLVQMFSLFCKILNSLSKIGQIVEQIQQNLVPGQHGHPVYYFYEVKTQMGHEVLEGLHVLPKPAAPIVYKNINKRIIAHPESVRSLKLSNVCVFLQLIPRPTRPKNQQ